MTGHILRSTIAVAALAMAGALTVSSAQAQPYGYYDSSYDSGPDYGITVYARPLPRERSMIGAPIDRVQESRVVYARDLDLSTYWGSRTLKHRIQNAARDACADLDARYPITVDSPRDCYDGAVGGAMRRVEYRLGFTPPDWY